MQLRYIKGVNMKVCRKCGDNITRKNQLRNYYYPGIQNTCKPCKDKYLKKHNEKKYKTIKDNPLW